MRDGPRCSRPSRSGASKVDLLVEIALTLRKAWTFSSLPVLYTKEEEEEEEDRGGEGGATEAALEFIKYH